MTIQATMEIIETLWQLSSADTKYKLSKLK